MERAREDLLRVKELDSSLSALVEKELSFFDKRLKEKEIEEKQKLVGKILWTLDFIHFLHTAFLLKQNRLKYF